MLPMRPELLKGHLDALLLAVLEPGPATRVRHHRIAALWQRRRPRSAHRHGLPGAAPAGTCRTDRQRLADRRRPPPPPTTSPQPGTPRSASNAPCGTSSPPPSPRSSRAEHGQPPHNHQHRYAPQRRARGYLSDLAAQLRRPPHPRGNPHRTARRPRPRHRRPHRRRTTTRPGRRPRSPNSAPHTPSPTHSAANWPPPTPGAPSSGSSPPDPSSESGGCSCFIQALGAPD